MTKEELLRDYELVPQTESGLCDGCAFLDDNYSCMLDGISDGCAVEGNLVWVERKTYPPLDVMIWRLHEKSEAFIIGTGSALDGSKCFDLMLIQDGVPGKISEIYRQRDILPAIKSAYDTIKEEYDD